MAQRAAAVLADDDCRCPQFSTNACRIGPRWAHLHTARCRATHVNRGDSCRISGVGTRSILRDLCGRHTESKCSRRRGNRNRRGWRRHGHWYFLKCCGPRSPFGIAEIIAHAIRQPLCERLFLLEHQPSTKDRERWSRCCLSREIVCLWKLSDGQRTAAVRGACRRPVKFDKGGVVGGKCPSTLHGAGAPLIVLAR